MLGKRFARAILSGTEVNYTNPENLERPIRRTRSSRTTCITLGSPAVEALGRETQVELHPSDHRIAINIDLGVIYVNSTFVFCQITVRLSDAVCLLALPTSRVADGCRQDLY